ncbi:ClpP/crotonase [Panus rudis PR-1116 ss-1]|nr:ClpP/crotonase [Panus rudis PR-1116 ss-1]
MTISVLSGKYIKVSTPSCHIALVEMQRPPVNAFNEEVYTEYGRVFDKISDFPDIRVVVLSSTLPNVFCAGIDLSALSDLKSYDQDPGRRALQTRSFLLAFQHAVSATERCPYPVIAAVHGIALGLPIDMVTACDIRYAASNAIFSIKEVDVGLAADVGTLARLPKVAGKQSIVNELAYTARNFSAAEAEKIGLISKVVEGGREEVLKAALETAQVIARKSPIAVLGTKRVLQHSRDHTIKDNLEYVATWNSSMLHSADIHESLQATLTKRMPKFAPLSVSSTKTKL